MNRLALRPALALVAAATVLTALSACAPADDGNEAGTSTSPSATGSSAASASPSADPCAKDSLQTHAAGMLTIATDKPVFPPWFVDDKPENGQGYEGAVAQAVAEKLGFTPDEVTWTRVPFNNVFKPTPKNWDFDINEFSITEKRKKALDFSSPYYDVTQAVVTTKGSKVAKATSLADLENAVLGAQVGTTSLQAIKDLIQPTKDPRVYNSNNDVVTALKNGQIDALVTDLPTAYYMSSVQLDGKGKILGQLQNSTGQQIEQFGLVLEKGSSLTACVSQAVDALRADGTLDALVDQWLSQQGAPVLG